jgi:hypothetical protein
MNANDSLATRFETDRPHLRAVAYRLLGSIDDADDAVQAAWLKVSQTDLHDVRNPTGWFTTVTARPSNGRTETGHPQGSSGLLCCRRSHGDELLLGGGQCGLDRGDLAEPALLLGLVKPADEVGVDTSQSRHLSWANPE